VELGIDDPLGDGLMALEEGALTPAAGLGATSRLGVDLRDEES
jgi:hypothetical protein